MELCNELYKMSAKEAQIITHEIHLTLNLNVLLKHSVLLYISDYFQTNTVKAEGALNSFKTISLATINQIENIPWKIRQKKTDYKKLIN